MGKGRHAAGRARRKWIVLGVAFGVLFAATGGTAYAAYRYDLARAGRILPGVTIDGVGVGGMTRAEATAAVARAVQPDLSRSFVITAGSKTWTETAASLGMHADVAGTVEKALALSASYPWISRVYHRWTGEPVPGTFSVPVALDPAPIGPLVRSVAAATAVRPRGASFSLVSGKLVMTHARPGRSLRQISARDAIIRALTAGASSVRLSTVPLAPKVPDSSVGETIVVNVSTNTLSLYDGFKVIRRYPVATAMPGFITPDGAWTVVSKTDQPTWINPAPNGWGAGEPAMIPPGPGNPLGTRALALSAPAILIHGTFVDSSVGHYASHGCIRMHIADSEALYPLVPVGTPVFIIGAPPWGISANGGPAG